MRRAVAIVVALGAAAPARAADQQWSVFASTLSTDNGAVHTTVSAQSLTARWAVAGESWEVLADVPFVTVSGPGVSSTSFGIVPTDNEGHDGGHGRASAPAATAAVTTTTASHRTWGFGDVRLGGVVRLVGHPADLFHLNGVLQVKAPTANSSNGLGSGKWDERLALAAEYRFWSATAFGAFGWNHLGSPSWATFRDVPDAMLGVESEPWVGRLLWSAWLEGNGEVVAGAGTRRALGIGVRQDGERAWRVLATAGLGGASEKYSLTVAYSFGWAGLPGRAAGTAR